jgi:hypothetical protein
MPRTEKAPGPPASLLVDPTVEAIDVRLYLLLAYQQATHPAGKPLTSKQLAAHLSVHHQTIARCIDRLTRAGWIKRTPRPFRGDGTTTELFDTPQPPPG